MSGQRRTVRGSQGFSLVEVMVALVVISVGMLGIAKMQGLSISSTSTARMRSLAAIEAASLASAMHADRAYWALSPPSAAVTVSGTQVTTSDGTLTGQLAAAPKCLTGAPCAPQALAAADLLEWAGQTNLILPNSSTTISCPQPVVPLPAICTIQITWVENAVAINKQEAAAAAASTTAAAFQTPTYTLYVEP